MFYSISFLLIMIGLLVGTLLVINAGDGHYREGPVTCGIVLYIITIAYGFVVFGFALSEIFNPS